MNELISLHHQTIGNEPVETVNARELHTFLESKQDFSTWIKNRIEKYEFVENQDFIKLHKKMELSKTGQMAIEYYVSVGMAKQLAMVENNEKGMQARKYFIECEERLKASQQVVQPQPLAQPIGEREDKLRTIILALEHTSLSDIAKETLIITSTETITDVPINYRPRLERKTYSATEIGEQLGISAYKVGKLTNAHNLKTDEYGMYVLDKVRGYDKQVENFRYYDNVIPILKAILANS